MATYNQEQLTKKNTIYDLRTALNENTTQLRGGTSYTPLPFSIPYSDDFNKLNVDWLSNQDITFTNITSTASTTVQGSFSAQQDVTVGSTLDVTGNGTFSNNVTVSGDLTVNGTSFTVDGETVATEGYVDDVASGLMKYSVSVTTTNKTLENGERCFVESPSLTITLPSTPSEGDIVSVSVLDFTDTIISRNGEKIMGLEEDMILDTEYASVTLVYTGIENGWRIK